MVALAALNRATFAYSAMVLDQRSQQVLQNAPSIISANGLIKWNGACFWKVGSGGVPHTDRSAAGGFT
jgi:hypothetical protein